MCALILNDNFAPFILLPCLHCFLCCDQHLLPPPSFLTFSSLLSYSFCLFLLFIFLFQCCTPPHPTLWLLFHNLSVMVWMPVYFKHCLSYSLLLWCFGIPQITWPVILHPALWDFSWTILNLFWYLSQSAEAAGCVKPHHFHAPEGVFTTNFRTKFSKLGTS